LWRTAIDAATAIALMLLIVGVVEFLPGSNVTGNMLVVDGDSLRPRDSSHDVRLEGIDAPELGQRCQDARAVDYACGRKARNHLRQLAAGKDVTCRTNDVDRYQRSISVCSAGGIELNRRMVADGWAISYRTGQFVREERAAKLARKGIWQGDFERPEDWRRLNRSDAAGGGGEPD
jgi:endonuclease YncB( thermonuclease family)